MLLSDRQAIYTEPLGRGLGRLLFLRDTTLLAQPFDLGSLELSGEPVPVADQVASFAPATVGLFSVSDTGVLAYRVGVGGNQVQLTWFDAEGKVLGTAGEKGAYGIPRCRPTARASRSRNWTGRAATRTSGWWTSREATASK